MKQIWKEGHYIDVFFYFVLGPGAGGSDDWAKGVARIKYVYTIELPGLNYPQGGFAPLESSLAPMIQETFEGIKAFVNYLKNKNNL